MAYKTDEWLNASGKMSGTMTHVRQNTSLHDRDRSACPHVLIVTLVFRSVDEEGMPADDDELHAADMAEEAIADRLESVYGALFGLVITCEGARDLFLFLPEELADEVISTLIEAEAPAFDYDFTFETDPEWTLYSNISELTRES